MSFFALFVSAAVGLASLGPEECLPPRRLETDEVDRTVIPYPTSDPEMIQAMQRARETLPRFFDLAESGIEAEFLLKMRLTGGVRDEHLWMQVLGYDGDVFCGIIASDPITPGYRYGDEVRLHRDDVEDWMVNTGKVRYGGYTVRVLLKSMDPAEAEKLRAQLRD